MKCVAERRCQVRVDGRVRTFAKGEVFIFEEVPPNFRPLEGAAAMAIDFETAGEHELLEADYDLDDLKAYIKSRYDKSAGNRGKEKTVEFLLDCRYRSIDQDRINEVL